MSDPLVEVTVRVYGDFADRATLAEVLAVIARARNDLDTPSAAALPELVERLARQRLADHLADRLAAPGTGSAPAEQPTGETGSSAPNGSRVRQSVAHGPGLNGLSGEGEPVEDVMDADFTTS